MRTAISSRRSRFSRLIVVGRKIGVTICEDIWTEHYLPRPLYDVELVRGLVEQGAEMIVNLSASPFSSGQTGASAVKWSARSPAPTSVRFVYCNVVGGNDQLVFDGNSIAFNRGRRTDRAAARVSRSAEAIVETDFDAPIAFRRTGHRSGRAFRARSR